MKKLLFLLTAFAFCLSFCGCTNHKTLQTIKIVTACSARGNDEYTFFIATPQKHGQDNQTTHTSYTFYEADFSKAVDDLKASSSNIDLSHISVFLTDEDYISNKFLFDAKHINKHLKISPLTKVFVTKTGSREIFDAISRNNSDSFSKYINASFRAENKNMLCTMTELLFSGVNQYYTVSIPYISLISEASLPKVSNALFYNSQKGTIEMGNTDYVTYADVINTFGKTSKLYKLSYSDKRLFIKMSDKIKDCENVIRLAEKYNNKGFDIFNSIYFSKKCFQTYFSYQKAINVLSLSDITFAGGKK